MKIICNHYCFDDANIACQIAINCRTQLLGRDLAAQMHTSHLPLRVYTRIRAS